MVACEIAPAIAPMMNTATMYMIRPTTSRPNVCHQRPLTRLIERLIAPIPRRPSSISTGTASDTATNRYTPGMISRISPTTIITVEMTPIHNSDSRR